ncbi:biofilm operon icaADBC HTH-type negative transcriptional regulator IcaR [Microcystis aeruginosa NIES-2520]|jgi:AcrR family transcriptional regulator|uniref:Biofilm operon icaADBC HTH-type negative transcriptional regulator IcaR n=2 Tax=Microcystis aeruginosa TaxID=1126 RepID=A0A5A5RUS9_MICAE|nr:MULTISPECIES: TetR/AcrR family transcriptional regulator [Microcystis]NCR77893.1 TetR/AcrR family transcriptional regulator [Microcystis aeruginosa K13-06]MCA2667094.1 TetR/AcrR family transcriptional regulator [Microcystis sp. M045S2]MCA2714239.1 TetR/AcrR family transcriptional regulator [Microcystis sp. M172S2]MCA2804664.1 TetR/AcrR family transcriptional regulator [Microcystis sp. M114S2]MCA2834776.1 TetR/AcrR family transcriptional regulator [Microcystis sp. M007S1]
MQSLFRRSLAETNSGEEDIRSRILQAALRLFAAKGYEGTTTKDLAGKANVAEGTLFRYFPNKKAILIEVATRGWVDILTDLLTELSEMGSYKAVAQVMRRRVLRMRENSDLLRVCFIEAQFHPELKERIQSEVIAKMTDVAEAFFQTAIDRGIYRPMNPKIVAQVFLGMFAIAGFSSETILDSNASPLALQEMAEGIAEIFLNGVLVK